MTTRIVIDTDPGIDDAMAILFAHLAPSISIEGLTTIMGNATLQGTTRNALYLVERFDIGAPVFVGAERPLILPESDPPSFVHGNDGMGNIDAREPELTVGDQTAAEYLSDITAANPQEITVVALGRLTNLALALQQDSSFCRNVKNVIIMGGAIGLNGFSGNVSPCAEANIAGDPHAADIVMRSELPLTMVGLDVTMKTLMSDDYMQTMRDAAGEIGEFIYQISRFYDEFHRTVLGMTSFPVHDSSAIAFAIQPELFKTKTGAIRVVTDGIATGQTIFAPDDASFPPGPWDGVPHKQVCVDIDSTRLLELYAATICAD